jgi:hypothetical protein
MLLIYYLYYLGEGANPVKSRGCEPQRGQILLKRDRFYLMGTDFTCQWGQILLLRGQILLPCYEKISSGC